MAESDGARAAFQAAGSISFDDEDVYEDDEDFEYLNIPSYHLTEESNRNPKVNEATPLCNDTTGKGLPTYRSVTSSGQDGVIPFTAIHRAALPYESDDRVAFIPGVRVDVEISDVEKHDHHVLNPYLYSIVVKHGEFEWTVKRRYKAFRSLHDALILFRAKLHLPVPTRRHRLQRQTFKQRRESLPRFPRKPELMVSEEDLPERKKQLVTYLQRILRFPPLRNHHETLKFFEVSHLSFINGLGYKNREGLIKKRSGGRSYNGRFCCSCCGQCIQNITAHYNKRWLVLKDTFLAYVNPHRGTVSDVLLMDQKFVIECGFLNTGVHHGLQLTTLNRELMLKGWTHRNAIEWRDAIQNVSDTVAKDFTTPNRHDSFAPLRPKSHAQWFVDGASYLASVADAMEAAKEEIFITDWWLSPEIYMKRPMTEGDKWRLDVILKRKASEGVKIFVMLFKEVEMALGINSYYTKQALLKLHPYNIKVLRHPDGLLLWSHHEKMVVIDQRIAYLGGIDLCYGRYDSPEHRLVDLGSVQAQQFVGYPYVGALQQNILNMLTDLGSIMTSVDLNDVPRQSFIRQESENENLVAGKFPIPVPTTPSYDRTISSHSWPETDHDKDKIGLVTPPTAGQEVGLDPARQRQLRLATISETSLTSEAGTLPSPALTNGTEPHISIEGAVTNESNTDQGKDQIIPTEAAITSTRKPILQKSDAIDGETETDSIQTATTETSVLDDNPEPLQTSNGTVAIKKIERQVSELSDKAGTSHTKKVPKDLNLTRQMSVETGHVNHGVVLTPTEEKTHTINPDISIEMIEPQTTHKLSASPPGPSSQSNVNNNVGEGKAADTEKGGAAKRIPGKPLSSKWKKVKAIAVMTRLTPHGIESTPDQPAEVAGRIPPGKRPPNLKLQKQGRVNEGSGTATNTLGLPDTSALGKPTTPVPKNKFTQKAQDLKLDIKEKFRKKQSKSVDVSEDTEFDFSFYKTLERTDHPDGILEDMGLFGSSKIWIGKDYVNFITKDFKDLDQPFSDFIDRTNTPRMPWHDIGAVVYGKAARDVARHFIQRWNFSKVEKRKTHIGYPLLLPKCYTKVSVPRGALASSIPCNVQVLRSASKWSAGISEPDSSIHNAYIDAIQNAKHFIYIENQFFITIMDHDQVENGISAALFARIMRAHREGTVFRVIVVMPLLPAFEGELGTPSGGAIQAVQHWNYASICRGGKSLIERLDEFVPDSREYVSFYGLRTHDELSGNLVTELVYVHSKMMIVDDLTVIIGSANINDRSLLGTRDSELAIITKDVHMRQSRMNGETYEAGWFASGLRQALFREHLGVSKVNPELDIIDPIHASFYKGEWMRQAAINTKVYDEVFHCLPTDNVETFERMKQYSAEGGLAKSDPEVARDKLKSVRGQLVFLPLNFLSKENVQPTVLTKEGLAPVATWT